MKSSYKKNFLVFFTLEQLIASRIHIGSSVKNWTSELYFLIHGIRRGLFILNLNVTLYNWRNSLLLLEQYSFSNLTLCFVFQNKFVHSRVNNELDSYIDFNLCFFTQKWFPGFISNYKNFYKNLLPLLYRYNSMSVELRKRYFSKRWIYLFEIMYGLRYCDMMPSVLCLITPKNNGYAMSEAAKLKIPVVSLVDSNMLYTDYITYALPANDESVSGLLLFFIAFKNSFFLGILKKRSHFLFIVNVVLRFLLNRKVYFKFKDFLILYFFLGSFILFMF